MFISEAAAHSIVQEIKEITGHNINIMDAAGVIFASTDPERIGQRHLGACQVLEQGLPRLVVQEDDGRPGGARRGINLPIQLDGQTVGVIGITGAPQEVESLGSVIKRMTEIMVRDTRRQEQEDLMDSARACFIENWLFAEEPDLTELELRGNMLGIDVTARWSVVILEVMAPPVPESPQEMRTALYLKHIRPYLPDRDRGLCAVINQRILLIFRDWNRFEVLARVNQIRGELESAYQAQVCGGMRAEGRRGLEIRRCYQEARTACRTARTSGGRVLFYDEVSLEFLADSIPPSIRRDLMELVFAGCTQEEREEVRNTVLLYFQCHGEVKEMARTLYVHKNTVHYRLQRIQEKTGYSVRDPKGAVLLYFACRFSDQGERE